MFAWVLDIHVLCLAQELTPWRPRWVMIGFFWRVCPAFPSRFSDRLIETILLRKLVELRSNEAHGMGLGHFITAVSPAPRDPSPKLCEMWSSEESL